MQNLNSQIVVYDNIEPFYYRYSFLVRIEDQVFNPKYIHDYKIRQITVTITHNYSQIISYKNVYNSNGLLKARFLIDSSDKKGYFPIKSYSTKNTSLKLTANKIVKFKDLKIDISFDKSECLFQSRFIYKRNIMGNAPLIRKIYYNDDCLISKEININQLDSLETINEYQNNQIVETKFILYPSTNNLLENKNISTNRIEYFEYEYNHDKLLMSITKTEDSPHNSFSIRFNYVFMK